MSTLKAAQVAEQEASLVLDSFTLADAVGLGAIAQSRAESEEMPLIIQVRHGRRIAFMVSLPGSHADSENWIIRKAAVVEKFYTSTMYQKLHYLEKGTTFIEATGLSAQEFAPYGGGMPIAVANVGIVGSIYASGLPDVDDHEFLVDCLRELKAAQSL
jgi:uncharacterized protein (UPF0303 family)